MRTEHFAACAGIHTITFSDTMTDNVKVRRFWNTSVGEAVYKRPRPCTHSSLSLSLSQNSKPLSRLSLAISIARNNITSRKKTTSAKGNHNKKTPILLLLRSTTIHPLNNNLTTSKPQATYLIFIIMSSINQEQPTVTTSLSGNALKTPLYAPFPTSAEMEALQHQLGALRILKTASSADEQSEAHYRRLVYADYEECVKALSSTTDSIDCTAKEISTYLRCIDYGLELYSRFLEQIDSKTNQQTPSDCLRDIRRMTDRFEDVMELFFRKHIWTEMLRLTGDQWSMDDAIDLLNGTLDSSSGDGILDQGECYRLLRELRTRKAEIVNALKGIEAVVSEVQDRTEKLCGNAARFLERSKVKDEKRCEGVCLQLESIGEWVGNITFYWEREQGDGEEEEEEEDEDDFRMEG